MPKLIVPAERTLIVPARDRHDVYYEMLSHLVLSDRHLNDLRERGLSDERISMNMYRTLPKSDAAKKFLAGMLDGFYDLSGIPGFHTQRTAAPNDPTWTIAGNGGLLIPVCDSQGYIQGLQIRLDDEDLTADARGSKRRYRWLSSRYKENGTKSGTWIHVTGQRAAAPNGACGHRTAYLTEGPLKGDVASFLANDALFICVAGINATDGLTTVIKSLGVTEILLAADMDKVTNPQVWQACKSITRKLLTITGVRVRVANWNPEYKGIDDYYLAHVNGQSDSLIFEAA